MSSIPKGLRGPINGGEYPLYACLINQVRDQVERQLVDSIYFDLGDWIKDHLWIQSYRLGDELYE